MREKYSHLALEQQQTLSVFEQSVPSLATLFLMDATVHVELATAHSGFQMPANFSQDMIPIALSKPRCIDTVNMNFDYDRELGQYEVESADIIFDNRWSIRLDESHMQVGQDGIFYKQTIKNPHDQAHGSTTSISTVSIDTMYRFLHDCGLPLTHLDEFGVPAAEEANPDGLEAMLPTMLAAQQRSLSASRSIRLSPGHGLVVSETLRESDRYGLRQTERNERRLGPFGVPNTRSRPPEQEALGGLGNRRNFSQEKTFIVRLVNDLGRRHTVSYEAVLHKDRVYSVLSLAGLYQRIAKKRQQLEEVEPKELEFDPQLLTTLSRCLEQATVGSL